MKKALSLLKLKLEMIYGTKFNPAVSESSNWFVWKSIITSTTCKLCISKNGTIFNTEHPLQQEPPLHNHCRCYTKRATSISA